LEIIWTPQTHLKLLDLFLKLSAQGLLILNPAQKLAGLKVFPGKFREII